MMTQTDRLSDNDSFSCTETARQGSDRQTQQTNHMCGLAKHTQKVTTNSHNSTSANRPVCPQIIKHGCGQISYPRIGRSSLKTLSCEVGFRQILASVCQLGSFSFRYLNFLPGAPLEKGKKRKKSSLGINTYYIKKKHLVNIMLKRNYIKTNQQ